MEIKLDEINNIDIKRLIKKELENSNLIAIPTDTVYGIACNCYDEKAILKLYELKKRNKNKPISVLASNIDQINKLVSNISDDEKKVIEMLMPRPITLVMQKSNNVNKYLSSNNYIGIRIPDKKEIIELIDFLGFPIATSSANLSNCDILDNICDIKKEFNDQISVYINDGKKESQMASTVFSITNGKINIIRQGKLTKQDIEKVI